MGEQALQAHTASIANIAHTQPQATQNKKYTGKHTSKHRTESTPAHSRGAMRQAKQIRQEGEAERAGALQALQGGSAGRERQESLDTSARKRRKSGREEGEGRQGAERVAQGETGGGGVKNSMPYYSRYALFLSGAILVLGIAILPFSYSLIPVKLEINLLFLAVAVFALGFWRDYRAIARDLRRILLPLGSLAVVILMSYVSLYWALDSRSTLTTIRHYLLEPSLLFLLSYLLARRLDSRGALLLLLGFSLALCYHPFLTIWDFLDSRKFASQGLAVLGYYRAMPSFFHTPDATLYAFWLALCFCFVLGFLCCVRGIARILVALLLLLVFAAVLANGSRFLILSCCVALVLPFLLLSYRYKARILLCVGVGILALGFSVYHFSDSLNPRFNVKNLVDNFRTVWSYYPAEMGRFSPDCYIELDCSTYSKEQDSNSAHIRYEESSLSRLSAMKSGLMIAGMNPLIPHGFGALTELMKNFKANYEEKLLPYRYSTENGERLPMPHLHHQWISFLCELGLVGLVAILTFFLTPLVLAQRALGASGDGCGDLRLESRLASFDSSLDSRAHSAPLLRLGAGGARRVLILALACFLGALLFMCNFDIMLWREENLVSFIIIGLLLGLSQGGGVDVR